MQLPFREPIYLYLVTYNLSEGQGRGYDNYESLKTMLEENLYTGGWQLSGMKITESSWLVKSNMESAFELKSFIKRQARKNAEEDTEEYYQGYGDDETREDFLDSEFVMEGDTLGVVAVKWGDISIESPQRDEFLKWLGMAFGD